MQRAYELIQTDIEKKRPGNRKLAIGIFAVGLLLALGAYFGISGRTDDLQSVLIGLGAFVSVLGGLLMAQTFKDPANTPYVVLFRDKMQSIRSLNVYRVKRSNAFVALRMEFFLNNGKRTICQLPTAFGEKCLEAIYRERPDLQTR